MEITKKQIEAFLDDDDMKEIIDNIFENTLYALGKLTFVLKAYGNGNVFDVSDYPVYGIWLGCYVEFEHITIYPEHLNKVHLPV